MLMNSVALKCLSLVPNDFQDNVNDSNVGFNESIFRKGFIITVTNIGTFYDHFAHYEKVDVWCSW